MHILLLFLDGIGLGDDNPDVNPFVTARMPVLTALTNGKRWLRDIGWQESERAIFIPTDPRLGVPGRPQSATGQAAILTGKNVPALLGEHYGPKPNPAIREIIAQSGFFKRVIDSGQKAALLDAYPPAWHHEIDRGKSLRSSYQQAAFDAGQRIFGLEDLKEGKALTPEWTGTAWREYLKLDDTPVYTPHEAGRKLVEMSREYAFAMHTHWMTDMVGHRGPLQRAVDLLELFDGVMAGILDTWDDNEGLVIMTSDHGNMELIGSRNHTENDVPTLVIGREKAVFAEGFKDLTDIVPHMAKLLGV